MTGVAKWCTVTVIDKSGQRHSLDVRAESSFDAAHLYLTTAKTQPQAVMSSPLPIPDFTTRFEVRAEGKVLHLQHRVRIRERVALQPQRSHDGGRRKNQRGPVHLAAALGSEFCLTF